MAVFKNSTQEKKYHLEDTDGARGVTKQVLLGPAENVPTAVLRKFEISERGHTPAHSHNWEHEVYILQGQGTVTVEGTDHTVQPGDAIYIEPHEQHQFRTMDESLTFLCIIPTSAAQE